MDSAHTDIACTVLRPVETDSRRQYFRMFSNVLNDGDFKLIESFFMQFCVPKPRLCFVHDVVDQRATPTNVCTLDGVDSLIALWCGVLQLSPDHVIRFGEPKVVHNETSGTSIIAVTCKAQCTLRYKITAPEIAEQYMRSRYVPTESKSSRKKTRYTLQKASHPPTEPFQHYVVTTGKLPELQSEAIELKIDAYAYFYLDSNKRIQGLKIRDIILVSPSTT